MPDSRDSIKISSIPLPSGGDTHIHTYGTKATDFTVTTRIPVGGGTSVSIHDNPLTGISDFGVNTKK